MTARRRNGEGTIEYHRGRWRVRVWVDGKRKTLGSYETREKAERMLRAHLALVSSGRVIATSKLTVAALGEELLDMRELDGNRHGEPVRAIADERSVWRRHVLPSELATKPVISVRVADVEAFMRWLRRRKAVSTVRKGDGVEHRETDRTISAQTQRHALRIVRQVFAEAVRRELIATNPAALVAAPKPRPNIDDDWLRQSEIDALLSCGALPHRDRTAYACALGLALRLDDILGARIEHLDLDCEVPGPHLRVWIAKSEKWHRVPIMAWLVPVLREHVATLPPGSRYLFPRKDGGCYGKSYDFGWAEKVETGRPRKPGALEVAGIKRRIRFHDLRGTCATHLALGSWGRRWSLKEIQDMLAHSDQRVTERYVRRVEDALAEAARGTTAGPSVAPSSPQRSQNNQRTLRDSNTRPSAPEADAAVNGSADLGRVGDTEGAALAATVIGWDAMELTMWSEEQIDA